MPSERIKLNAANKQLLVEVINFLTDNYAGEFNSWEEDFFGNAAINVMRYHNISEAQFDVIEKCYKKYDKRSLPFDFDDLKPKPKSPTDDINF